MLLTVAAARAEVEQRVQRTFIYIGAITLGALLVVFVSGMMLNIRERRLADAKLKELTQRVFDAQEDERGRVARELHDGISQILVGVRYTLDNARRRLAGTHRRSAHFRRYGRICEAGVHLQSDESLLPLQDDIVFAYGSGD